MDQNSQIEVKHPGHLTVAPAPSWLGHSLKADAKIPRLLLMQGTSEFVKEGKAKAGDVVRSTTGSKVGSIGHPVPLILLSYPSQEWVIEVKQGAKFKYVKTEARTLENMKKDWKFFADEDGAEVKEGTKGALAAKRIRMGSFFALLPGDMDAFLAESERVKKGALPDLSIEISPVQIRCRSFSYEVSLAVEKMLRKIADFHCQPWQFILDLSVKEMNNEEDSWFVYDFDLRQKGKPVPSKYADTAKGAFEFVQDNYSELKVDKDKDQDTDQREIHVDTTGHF
jgi:hypothetical protein